MEIKFSVKGEVMSYISKVELKYQLQQMGIKVEGNHIKKKDIEEAIASPVIDLHSKKELPFKKIKDRIAEQDAPMPSKKDLIHALVFQMLRSKIIFKVLGIEEDLGDIFIKGFEGLNKWPEDKLKSALLSYLTKYDTSFTKKYHGNLNAFVKDNRWGIR